MRGIISPQFDIEEHISNIRDILLEFEVKNRRNTSTNNEQQQHADERRYG